MTNLPVGDRVLRVEEIVRFGSDDAGVTVSDDVRLLVARARGIVDRHRESGDPVYGLTTALGSLVGTRIDASVGAAREHDVVTGRMVGIGAPYPVSVAKSAMAIRLHGLGRGAAGVSPAVVDTLAAMINAGIVVRAPTTGTIGASDLAPGAALAGALIGVGSVWRHGEVHDAGEALRLAGLSPVELAPKDALGVINSSAFSYAHAAHVVMNCRVVLSASLISAIADADAFGANPRVYSPPVYELRPMRHAERIADLATRLMEGSWAFGGVVAPQQAISFRAIVPRFGSVVGALERFTEALEAEINSVGDNPAVLVASGEMSSTPHFDTVDLALHGDALSLSLHHWGESCVQRVQRSINHRVDELPPLLARGGDGATGFNPLQKTLGDLRARMRHLANPASLDSLVVSDQVEDLASQLPLVVEKLDRQVDVLRRLIAIEALVALQSHALRAPHDRSRATRLLADRLDMVEAPYPDGVPVGLVVDRIIEQIDALGATALTEIARSWPSCPLVSEGD